MPSVLESLEQWLYDPMNSYVDDVGDRVIVLYELLAELKRIRATALTALVAPAPLTEESKRERYDAGPDYR